MDPTTPTATIEGAEPPAASSAGSVSASIRDRADPSLVLGDRVEQLYSQMWLGIVLFITASSAGLVIAYRRAPDRATNPEQWLRWLGIAALANGANWGFAGAVFFPSHADEQQVFLAFLLAGMMSAGIPVYAASWPIFAIYAFGIVAPFTYVLATFGNRLFAEIAR